MTDREMTKDFSFTHATSTRWWRHGSSGAAAVRRYRTQVQRAMCVIYYGSIMKISLPLDIVPSPAFRWKRRTPRRRCHAVRVKMAGILRTLDQTKNSHKERTWWQQHNDPVDAKSVVIRLI